MECEEKLIWFIMKVLGGLVGVRDSRWSLWCTELLKIGVGVEVLFWGDDMAGDIRLEQVWDLEVVFLLVVD
jgi:hypothetical protein